MRYPRPGIWIEKKCTMYLHYRTESKFKLQSSSIFQFHLFPWFYTACMASVAINSLIFYQSTVAEEAVAHVVLVEKKKWLAASLKVKALRHHGSFHLLQSDQFFSGDPIPSLGLSYNSTHSFNYSQWALKLLKYAIFVRINNEIIDAIMTRIKGSFQAFRKERVLSAEVDN